MCSKAFFFFAYLAALLNFLAPSLELIKIIPVFVLNQELLEKQISCPVLLSLSNECLVSQQQDS